MLANRMMMSATKPKGQQLYDTPGTYTFTVPALVTSISVACIGGGQGGWSVDGGDGGTLAYSNAILVSPGSTYTVTVGAGGPSRFASGSRDGEDSSFGALVIAPGGGSLSTAVGQVSYAGGNGGIGTGAGGGGAGGYSGTGGNGGANLAAGGNGAGGAGGGGGGGQNNNYPGGGGGGTGIKGSGTSGNGGTAFGNGGGAGSNGSAGGAGVYAVLGGGGGAYGGGAGGGTNVSPTVSGGSGGGGAVRIIWGVGRSYPNNAADV